MSVNLSPIRRQLANGATLLALGKHDLPLVAIEAFVPPGQLAEPAEQAGLAQLVGRLLSEGTHTLTADTIAEELESLGGELTTGAAGASLTLPALHAARGLELLLACLFEAEIPEAAFDRVRESQLATIAAAVDDPAQRVRQAFDALVYGDHPYGRPTSGHETTVRAITRHDALAYHQHIFAPDQLVLAIAGDIAPNAAVTLCQRALAKYQGKSGPRPSFAAPLPLRAATQRIALPGKEQSHILLGHLGIRRTDPDYDALQLLDVVLGAGSGFTDRLSQVVRDELGLAYSVYGTTTSGARLEPGVVLAYVATTPEHERTAAEEVVRQLVRICEEPVTASELADAQAYLCGSFAFEFETANQLARYLIAWHRYELGNYHQEYPSRIEALTPVALQNAAQRHIHPDQLIHVVAGPPDDDGLEVAS
jgi:zinc protease